MPHFYKENSGQKESMEREQNKIDEYEYCELFWQYTNCQHENYKIDKLAKLQGVEIINMGDIGKFIPDDSGVFNARTPSQMGNT